MMKWFFTWLLAGSLIATIPALARAAPASEPPGPAAPGPSGSDPAAASVGQGRWYGWELFLSDVLFLAIAADGSNQHTESGLGSAGLPIGLLGLVLVPPAIHYVHGNPRRAVVGGIVRGVTASLWGAVLSSENTQGGPSCDGEGHCPGLIEDSDIALIGLATAALIGTVVFVAIDDLFFARAAVDRAPPPSLTLAPALFLRADGGVVGMAGRF
ncbi:MAG TPA: hypothetical protein VGP07_23170 [Polyangia bacterium]|jgi:hypothetical protein